MTRGEFIAVVGPSGSGKSTLLHTIGGLIRPDSGELLFNGASVYSLKPAEADRYRRKNVGFVFQQFHLVPYLTVWENLRLVGAKHYSPPLIRDYIDRCGLSPLEGKYPSELSVGEKQRVAFLRAILPGPDILLADEPTGNLDPQNSKILLELIGDFNREGGTVLLVSHQPETARYAQRSIRLSEGQLIP
ncbi:MAG: ABC transporter ATP-binding protein [Prolixibacteraceae bacterium]|nr:ABC transporter ATP-binding protein [Prolixibacteraceae bacterium]